MQTIRISSPAELPAAADRFVALMDRHKIFAFRGAMGAGKTTLIKAICKALGVAEIVNSPTFAIVNEYRSDTIAGPIYHFDFYRIRTIQEACDMGIEDYLICGAPCFIEWPEKIEALLPPDTLFVTIETQEDETHIVKMLCSRERS